MVRVQRTLPFAALGGDDFERLCLALVAADSEYSEAEHFGGGGGDSGRDIVAIRGGERVVFQCKGGRHSFSKSVALDTIDSLCKLGDSERPAQVEFLVAVNVSASMRDKIKTERPGINISFRGATELDAWIGRYPEIQKKFFGETGTSSHSLRNWIMGVSAGVVVSAVGSFAVGVGGNLFPTYEYGTVVVQATHNLDYIWKVGLDGNPPEIVHGSFKRFDEVSPGTHRLRFVAQGYIPRDETIDVKRGKERHVTFHGLHSASDSQEHALASPVASVATVGGRSFQIWSRVPDGSYLEMDIAREGNIELSAAGSIIDIDGEEDLDEERLFPGPALIEIDSGAMRTVRLWIRFAEKGSATVRSRVVRRDGIQHGDSYIREISGDAGGVVHLTFSVLGEVRAANQ